MRSRSDAGVGSRSIRRSASSSRTWQRRPVWCSGTSGRSKSLRASRQRLVGRAGRRTTEIERNLHDGAQQQLVRALGPAQACGALAGTDPEKEAASRSRRSPPKRTPPSRTSGASRAGSIRPCWRTRARRGAREPGAEGRGADDGRSTTASDDTERTSNRRSTSARSKRSTTSRSTPRRVGPSCGCRSAMGTSSSRG